MSEKVVRALSGAGNPPRQQPKNLRLSRRAKSRGLVLDESTEFEEFSTLDLLSGLHGICHALDRLEGSERSLEQYGELGTAAKVLSSMLIERILL